MLSRTRIKEEIAATKEAIKKLQETAKRCEDGILVNEIVLAAFEMELSAR